MKELSDDHRRDEMLNISKYSEADHLFNLGHFLEALSYFQASLAADPADGDALHAIGNCYDALKQPAHAIAAFRSAIPLLPASRHPALHFNIGNGLFDLGKYAQALAEFQLVPPSSPEWSVAAMNIKLARERLGSRG